MFYFRSPEAEGEFMLGVRWWLLHSCLLLAGGTSRLGVHKKPGELTPMDQRDIPCHMTRCSAIKAGGKEEGEGH